MPKSLRYENNSAFEHSLWDRYDLLSTLGLSDSLDELDETQRETYKYSFVQDGYYALLGREPILSDDEVVTRWLDFTSRQQFKKLQAIFSSNQVGRIKATTNTARLMEYHTFQQENETDADEENDTNGQEEENQQQAEDGDEGQSQQDSPEQSTEGDDEPEDGTETDTGTQGGDSTQGTEDQTPTQGTPTQDTKAVGPQGFDVNDVPEIVLDKLVTDTEQESETIAGLLPYVGEGDFSEQYHKAERLAGKFDVKELAQFLGFAKRAVKGAHRRSDASTGEFTGYRNVEWADNLHPVDLIGIAKQDMHTLARMSEGALRSRKFEEQRAKGRGPVILCRDESSSMRYLDGVAHRQAQELEIALASAFNSDKRDLVSIAWNDKRTRTHVYGEGDATGHLNSFLSGGTHLSMVLREAVETATEYVAGADILILTDGEVGYDEEYEEIVKEYRKDGGRVWCILLDGLNVDGMKWVDGLVSLDSLNCSETLGELITSMNTKRAKDGEKRRVF